jgi:DNA-binding transcriptional LysR family regulator
LTPKPPDYLIGKKVMRLGIGIYASQQYLKQHSQWNQLVLWNDEIDKPEWAQHNFPHAEVVIRANDVTTLLACLKSHMGITMLPCYIGDSAPELVRLDLPLQDSSWGVWVLSHVDLRSTARVRACREFLVDILEQQGDLISGTSSSYWQH